MHRYIWILRRHSGTAIFVYVCVCLCVFVSIPYYLLKLNIILCTDIMSFPFIKKQIFNYHGCYVKIFQGLLNINSI